MIRCSHSHVCRVDRNLQQVGTETSRNHTLSPVGTTRSADSLRILSAESNPSSARIPNRSVGTSCLRSSRVVSRHSSVPKRIAAAFFLSQLAHVLVETRLRLGSARTQRLDLDCSLLTCALPLHPTRANGPAELGEKAASRTSADLEHPQWGRARNGHFAFQRSARRCAREACLRAPSEVVGSYFFAPA